MPSRTYLRRFGNGNDAEPVEDLRKVLCRIFLLRNLRDGGYLPEDHPGGCTLFDKKEQVEGLSKESK